MSEEAVLEEAGGGEILEAESAEERSVVTEGLSKTTAQDRAAIREEVAEGRMTPSQCAKKWGISPQYVSKLLKAKGIRFASAKLAREQAEKDAKEAAERKAKASFAERKMNFAEEHKMAIYAQMRNALMLEGVRQKLWREAAMAPAGAVLPTVKDAMTSARTMALIDQRIRILLGLDEEIEEASLPSIEIVDMGDAEIIAARRGAINDDDLAKLDDDIVEETA